MSENSLDTEPKVIVKSKNRFIPELKNIPLHKQKAL